MTDPSHGVHVIRDRRDRHDDRNVDFETLTQATLRVDEAERSLRVAKIRLNTLVPGTPLRLGVEATRRLHAADAELEAARVAYEAAQDLPAPED
jgi:hypothetical protein